MALGKIRPVPAIRRRLRMVIRAAVLLHEGTLDYATYIVHNRPSFRWQYGARVPV